MPRAHERAGSISSGDSRVAQQTERAGRIAVTQQFERSLSRHACVRSSTAKIPATGTSAS